MRKYELKPEIKIKDINIFKFEKLLDDIYKKTKDLSEYSLVFETYPGVDLELLKYRILNSKIEFDNFVWSEDFALSGDNFRDAIHDDLTDDRVFGVFTRKKYFDFFDARKVNDFIKQSSGKKNIVFGIGANYLVENPNEIIYLDISRWEAQLRFRDKKRVFFGGTLEKENIQNFKRGYFIEWRMADKIKNDIANKVSYFVDSIQEQWNVISKNDFFESLNNVSNRPFRLVPYFDAGVWGGKWMEEKFELGKNKFNRWAWGFDGVPEENSIIITNGISNFEMPAINLCFFTPIDLLGEAVWNRFGNEFPIRFDFLDTIGGGNLSLQVHPTTQYMKEKFGGSYTQEESYYILDVDNEVIPKCYLGMKTGVNQSEFINALSEAQKTNEFDVDKYVNSFVAKKHDHFIHPSGVVHSSASGCMVLEVSSTPYIFTFKLWDWGRVDFDGKPRPININHGSNVIDYSFDTERTQKELVSPTKKIFEDSNIKIEKTGLHNRQFIETIRYTFKNNEAYILKCNNSVNMLNVIDGQEVIIESLDNKFESLNVRFGETFIIPESCKEVIVRPIKNNGDLKILQAFVRTR